MTNTERLTEALHIANGAGCMYVDFLVGKYTGNGSAVVDALRRRGFKVTRQPAGGAASYRLEHDPDSDTAKLLRHRFAGVTVHPAVSTAVRNDAARQRTALTNCQEQLQVAIGHLHEVLNKPRTHEAQQRADTAAREWLASIGSEPT